jgi:hypothetical protein
MAKEKATCDENKTLYNKVQIEYLNKRIDKAIDRVMERWDAAHPEPDELSDDEKFAQIVAGQATLLSWAYMQRIRGMQTDLEDAFTFINPREKEAKEWEKQRNKFESNMQKLRAKAEELIYLGNQADLITFINTIEDMHP